MPTFNYQAKKGPKDIIDGRMEAATREEVVSRLLSDGLVPMYVITSDSLRDSGNGVPRVRISGKERRLLTRQLTSLMRAKVELVPAVAMMKDQSPSRSLYTLLDDMERHMREGNSFSSAISRHPRIFSPLFLSAIRAGEMAGKLDDILIKLVEFGDQKEKLEGRLKGALAYPILLGVIGAACIGFFIGFVVPRMGNLFAQLDAALPWPTRALLNAGNWLTVYWAWLLAGIIGIVFLIQYLRRLPSVSAAIERALMWLPLSRTVLEARRIAQFSRTLQMLLQSGLPVFQAMDAARPTLTSALIEPRMRRAQEQVMRGDSIAQSLKSTGCFPPLVTHLIAVGETGGTLVEVLDEIASYYERSLDETLRITTSLLEPMMIIVMGILVGFCVLAMVLPIFRMTQLVG